MPTERFPRAKYLRQLAAIQHELQDWRIEYLHAQDAQPDNWLGSKFGERCEVVTTAIDQVVELRNTLYRLPRLS
jgi:hypothetical protein